MPKNLVSWWDPAVFSRFLLVPGFSGNFKSADLVCEGTAALVLCFMTLVYIIQWSLNIARQQDVTGRTVKGWKNTKWKERQRREHWSELSLRVIAKGKTEESLCGVVIRVGEQGSVCEVSELMRMERTDQASERDTNQRLLIASGVPGERSICGEGERRGEEGRKDNCSRQLSKNTKECHIICRLCLSAGHSGEWAEVARWFMFDLVQSLLTGNGCSDTPLPNACTSQSVHLSITHPSCM